MRVLCRYSFYFYENVVSAMSSFLESLGVPEFVSDSTDSRSLGAVSVYLSDAGLVL